jgi:diacylglycerol O-acyltransferase
MDFEKPLWQLFFFERYVGEDGVERSAVMLKGHHCMHDGFTALRMMMHGADPRAPPEDVQQQSRSRGRAGHGQRASCCATLVNAWRALRQLLLMSNDPVSHVKSQVYARPEDAKVCAWHTLRNIAVQDLKDFGRSEAGGGATINDILLTALGGALRRYCSAASAAESAAPLVPEEITACIWVARAPLAHVYKDFDEVPLKWGNSTLGACYIKIPLHEPTSANGPVPAALADMKVRTSAPELMIQALLATKFLGMFGVGPRVLMRPLWRLMCNKISISTSNVPGPSFDLAWCGAAIDQMVFFVPPTGTISVFLTVMTYAGKVTVGMGADGALLSPHALKQITGEFFEAELIRMMEF